MGIIKQLPEDLSNLISAGEVIERPLSVVKELVENAIDAGSSRIEIFIKDGGKSYISVRDDGEGMDKEDLENCIKKYATSKISEKEDLYRIATLGFRGEALYSICSISRLKITSRKKDFANGWQLVAVGGQVVELRETGARKGTFIEVEDLFLNIPARKKFLKSNSWEKTLIIKFIEEMSLIYPRISFLLNCDGKDILLLNATDNFYGRARSLFPQLTDNLLRGCREDNLYKVIVYLSKNIVDMANFQAYSVNKRLVKEKVIMKAVTDSFSIQSQKPPFIFIELMLPTFDIDVNVHPTKREIKFKNSEKVYKLVRDTIEETLKEKSYIKINSVSGIAVSEERQPYFSEFSTYAIEKRELFSADNYPEEKFRVLAVFAKCYLLVESGNELYIIDQHAVHERLIYNKILNHFSMGKSKKMIMPYIFNANEGLRALLIEHKEELEKIGFLYEEVGPKTFALTDIPEFLENDLAVTAFSELIKDELLFSRKDLMREVAAKVACKEAVKKGDLLSRDEIERLINDFKNVKTEGFCPHGRGFILKITVDDLEKLFSRK